MIFLILKFVKHMNKTKSCIKELIHEVKCVFVLFFKQKFTFTE